MLILPAIAAMSDAQCAAVRKFVAKGGALIATGQTSLYNEFGDARATTAWPDLFGAHLTGAAGVERPSPPDTPFLSASHSGIARGRVGAGSWG